MSAEWARQFVDANILVYAFDASAGAKQAAAQRLLADLWEHGSGCLSVQVLQEFFVVVTRKLPSPMSPEEAADRIADFARWRIFSPTAADVLAAIAVQREARISFWDAMIVVAASELGCDVLWTEDLAHGQRVRGVEVRNPFSQDARKLRL